MAVRTILLMGNPVLRRTSDPVRDFDTEEIRALVQDLRDTLADFRTRHGFGRAIAAPQIGVNQRVVYMDAGAPIVFFNPVFVRRSRKRILLWDDCFSLPELVVKVRRSLSVVVRYQDERGRARTLTAEGALSELLQHEIDHLDGILTVDRAIDSTHIVYRSEVEKLEQKRGPVAL
jgi:peptide deformylase